MKHRVVFTPSGLSGEVGDGTTVLAAARQLGVDLDSVCGGRGICGRCQVVPSIGAFAKWNITTTGERARRVVGARARLSRRPPARRRTPPRLRRADPRRRRHRRAGGEPGAPPGRAQGPRRPRPAPARRRPAVRLALRRGRSGGSSAPGCRRGDLVIAAVADQHGEVVDALARRRCCRSSTRRSPAARRPWPFATVGSSPIWPGFVDEAYGVAVDVGSTTIAGHLCAPVRRRRASPAADG